MVISTSAFSTPVGAIRSWIRADNTVDLPGGWLICDGSVVVDSGSPFNGKTLPDLRAQFPRGHSSLDNSNFAADILYYAGGTIPAGGADSGSFGHSHSLPSHDHSFSITSSSTAGGQDSRGGGNPAAHGVHNHLFSGNTNSHSGTSGSALSAVDNRPAFVETVTIIKVK